MNKFIFALLFLSGCFWQTEDTPAYSGSPFEVPDPPDKAHVDIVRCNTVKSASPDAACSTKQPSVMRCTSEIENPDTDHCAGPSTSPKQQTGSVWCCE